MSRLSSLTLVGLVQSVEGLDRTKGLTTEGIPPACLTRSWDIGSLLSSDSETLALSGYPACQQHHLYQAPTLLTDDRDYQPL